MLTYLQIALSHGFNRINAKLSICSSVNWALTVDKIAKKAKSSNVFIFIFEYEFTSLNCRTFCVTLKGASVMGEHFMLRFNASVCTPSAKGPTASYLLHAHLYIYLQYSWPSLIFSSGKIGVKIWSICLQFIEINFLALEKGRQFFLEKWRVNEL